MRCMRIGIPTLRCANPRDRIRRPGERRSTNGQRYPMGFDHYRVLGVDRSASEQEIKRAYRALVKHCHPDRNPDPAAVRIFHAVHEAYTTLMDADARAAHDALLRTRDALYAPHRTSTIRNTPLRVPDIRTRHWAFVGLHITGLVFGLSLLISITFGTVFLGWPMYSLALTIPGLVVLPDSLAGLRTK